MSTFKEHLKRDIDRVLFNVNEAADLHVVEGRGMPVIIDSTQLEELKAKSQYAEGIASAELLVFVKAADLGYKPAVLSHLSFDEDEYRVLSVSGELVYQLVLGANC